MGVMASMIGRRTRRALGAVAVAVAAALCAPAGAEPILPAPGERCRGCYAVVVDLAQTPGLTSAERRAEALAARGFDVVRLDRPSAHRLIHHALKLFRERGAERDARLVFWYSGPVEGGAEDGLALLLPAAPDAGGAPLGSGVPGLDLRRLLALAGESAAAEALLLLDAPIPAEAPLPLAESPEAGAGPRLLLTRASGGPLAPLLDTALSADGAIELAGLAERLSGLARLGYLGEGDGAGRQAPAARPDPALPLGAAREIEIPTDFDTAGLAAPAPRLEDQARLCDRLAADPEAPETRGRGRPLERVDGTAALEACRAAMLAEPETLRFAYQYARALIALGRAGEAVPWLERAARLGHLPSQFAYGAALFDGRGTRQDQRAGLGFIERAAEQGYAPAVRRLAEIAMRPEGRFIDRTKLRDLLRQAAREDPASALALGELIERSPDRTERMEREALRYFEDAEAAGLAAGRAGADRMREAIRNRQREDVAAACARLLDFDVMAIESMLGLDPDGEGWQTVVSRRAERALARVDGGRAVRDCAKLLEVEGADPALLAKLGYLLFRADMAGAPKALPTPERQNVFDVIGIAAERRDPTGLYLQGYLRLVLTFQALRSQDEWEAGKRASLASENLLAAYESGVAQAGYFYGLLNLQGLFAELPGFRADPGRAKAILERLEPRSPMARRILVKLYGGAEGYRHLPAFRDPEGLRRLQFR